MIGALPQLAMSTLGVPASHAPRKLIERAAAEGFRAVLLDTARPGIRPRDLDRSARRGLASLLRRLELTLAGAELWIPPEHFASPEHCDRAVAAAQGAIDLLAELSGLIAADRTLTLTLPAQGAEEAADAISGVALRAEVGIACPDRSAGGGEQRPPLGVCLDPMLLERRGEDAIAVLTGLTRPPQAARWSYRGSRRAQSPDPLAYASALSVVGFSGAVALDLRDAPDPDHDAQPALAAWRRADPFSD
ncbi:MAG: hypothetical protein H6814_11180 [Phycisphaeraceae bacterium]|nr:hypothetical protein [Phycisphaeraceae bacterium]